MGRGVLPVTRHTRTKYYILGRLNGCASAWLYVPSLCEIPEHMLNRLSPKIWSKVSSATSWNQDEEARSFFWCGWAKWSGIWSLHCISPPRTLCAPSVTNGRTGCNAGKTIRHCIESERFPGFLAYRPTGKYSIGGSSCAGIRCQHHTLNRCLWLPTSFASSPLSPVTLVG